MNIFILKKYFPLTVIFFWSNYLFYSQPFIQEIEEIIPNDFVQHSIAKWDRGEYAIVGTVTPGVLGGDSDVLLLKTDDFGNIHWMRYISSPDYLDIDSFAGSIIIDE